MDESLKHRNLALLLLQARECVMGNFRRILNHHGLTEQQWRVIRAISDNGAPMEQWQICATCHILSPSLAGVLARMEEMQLVDRNRVDTDQRRIQVALTASSRSLIRAIAPLIEQQYANLEQGVGSEVVRNLYEALDVFLAHQQAPVELVELPEVSKRVAAKSAARKRSAALVATRRGKRKRIGQNLMTAAILNLDLGRSYDLRYEDAEVHCEGLGRLADFFGRNMVAHRHARTFQVHLLLQGEVRLRLDESYYHAKAPLFS